MQAHEQGLGHDGVADPCWRDDKRTKAVHDDVTVSLQALSMALGFFAGEDILRPAVWADGFVCMQYIKKNAWMVVPGSNAGGRAVQGQVLRKDFECFIFSHDGFHLGCRFRFHCQVRHSFRGVHLLAVLVQRGDKRF